MWSSQNDLLQEEYFRGKCVDLGPGKTRILKKLMTEKLKNFRYLQLQLNF